MSQNYSSSNNSQHSSDGIEMPATPGTPIPQEDLAPNEIPERQVDIESPPPAEVELALKDQTPTEAEPGPATQPPAGRASPSHRMTRTTRAAAAENRGLSNLLRAPEAVFDIEKGTVTYDGETDRVTKSALAAGLSECRSQMFVLEDQTISGEMYTDRIEDLEDTIKKQKTSKKRDDEDRDFTLQQSEAIVAKLQSKNTKTEEKNKSLLTVASSVTELLKATRAQKTRQKALEDKLNASQDRLQAKEDEARAEHRKHEGIIFVMSNTIAMKENELRAARYVPTEDNTTRRERMRKEKTQHRSGEGEEEHTSSSEERREDEALAQIQTNIDQVTANQQWMKRDSKGRDRPITIPQSQEPRTRAAKAAQAEKGRKRADRTYDQDFPILDSSSEEDREGELHFERNIQRAIRLSIEEESRTAREKGLHRLTRQAREDIASATRRSIESEALRSYRQRPRRTEPDLPKEAGPSSDVGNGRQTSEYPGHGTFAQAVTRHEHGDPFQKKRNRRKIHTPLSVQCEINRPR